MDVLRSKVTALAVGFLESIDNVFNKAEIDRRFALLMTERSRKSATLGWQHAAKRFQISALFRDQ